MILCRETEQGKVMKEAWRKYEVAIQRWEEPQSFGILRKSFTEEGALRRALKGAEISED